MNYDYKFGSDSYNYYKNVGIKSTKYQIMAPEQSQKEQPGMEYGMNPLPIFDNPNYIGTNKLKDKVAIITGADSGLGKSAAIEYIEQLGGECLLLSGDITDKKFCQKIKDETLKRFGKINILVNNAGVQYQQDNLECISDYQFDHTMKVNVYGMFYLTKEILPYLKAGDSIINLTSVTCFYKDPQLIDYVTTKGAIVGFTRALARNLA